MGYHSPVDVPASIPTREIFAPLPALSTYDAPSASLTSSPSSHHAQKRSMDVPLRPASTRSPLPPVEGLSLDNILPGVPTGEFISLHQQETCSPPFQHPSGSEPTWFPVPQGQPMLAFVPSNPGSFQCHSAGFGPRPPLPFLTLTSFLSHTCTLHWSSRPPSLSILRLSMGSTSSATHSPLPTHLDLELARLLGCRAHQRKTPGRYQATLFVTQRQKVDQPLVLLKRRRVGRGLRRPLRLTML